MVTESSQNLAPLVCTVDLGKPDLQFVEESIGMMLSWDFQKIDSSTLGRA